MTDALSLRRPASENVVETFFVVLVFLSATGDGMFVALFPAIYVVVGAVCRSGYGGPGGNAKGTLSERKNRRQAA